MKIGRVTGQVVCTRKTESLEGVTLLLIQPLDDGEIPRESPWWPAIPSRRGRGIW